MKQLAIIAAAIATALYAPRAVHAGSSCGGGSSSGSSSSSSSSSSSGSSSSSSSSSSSYCYDESNIVGRRHCRKFAPWRMRLRTPIQLSMGTTVRSFSLTDTTFSGTAQHDDAIAFRMDGEQASQGAQASAVTFDMQATVNLARHVYAGFSMSAGGMMLRSPDRMAQQGDLAMAASGSLYMSGGGVAGIVIPTRWGSVKSEMVVGRRLLLTSVETRHFDCESESFAHSGQWVAAPKIVLDKWINPWMSTGVSVGTNLLNRREMSMGLVFRGHLRAFDGSRSR